MTADEFWAQYAEGDDVTITWEPWGSLSIPPYTHTGRIRKYGANSNMVVTLEFVGTSMGQAIPIDLIIKVE